METNTGKESIVSRLFGFGKKKKPETAPEQEAGFARTENAGAAEAVADASDRSVSGSASGTADVADEPSITVPEQVIRIRTSSRKDEAVNAIGESFRELSSVLASVNERLDRQDGRAVDLTEHLSELPEYLRALPRLQEEQNGALNAVAKAQEGQARAAEGMAQALERIPDAMRDGTAATEQAIRKVAAAQQQTAKVMHHGNQRSLDAFQETTQKSLQQQQRQVDNMLEASRRMFKTTVIFMAITLVAVVAVVLLG